MELNILLLSILLPLIDSLYLYNVGKPVFGKAIRNIQGTDMTINYTGVIGSYFFLILGLYFFIFRTLDSKKSWKSQIFKAFILGIVIYGVYEFTNMAIIEKWTMNLVIIDTIWGGLLFSIITYIALLMQQRLH